MPPKSVKGVKGVKGVKFESIERPCIKPEPPARKNTRMMSFYGSDASRIRSKDPLKSICPSFSPYVGYLDGVYCCLPSKPTALEQYKYWTLILDSIEEASPSEEELAHWSAWSGLPTDEQEHELLKEMVPPKRYEKLSKKDARWRHETYVKPKNIVSDTKRYIINERNKILPNVPCMSLKTAPECSLKPSACFWTGVDCLPSQKAGGRRRVKNKKKFKQTN